LEVRPAASTAQEWQEVTVEDLKAPIDNALATGPFGSNIGSRFFDKQGVPVIRGANLSADGITQLIDNGFVFVSEAKAAELRRSVVARGDLVFTCWGTINQVGLIGSRAAYPRYIISNKQMKFTPDASKADSLFLFYLFSGPTLQRTIINQSIGSSIPGFNLGQLRTLRLRIPPLREQRTIAATLSDVDTLLEELTEFIAKKWDVRKAVAQQLLSGQTRLAGYRGEWEVKRLGEVADLMKGKGLSKAGVSSSGTRPCLLYGELFTRYGRVISEAVSKTAADGGLPSRAGDVLVPGSTTTVGIDLAIASALLQDGVALGGDINVIRQRSHSYDPVFLANYLTHVLRRAIAERAQGITIVHLYGRELSTLLLRLPSVAEQSAIAAVLCDMDAELAALEQRLAKTHALKHGMMQQLLNGNTRLV